MAELEWEEVTGRHESALRGRTAAAPSVTHELLGRGWTYDERVLGLQRQAGNHTATSLLGLRIQRQMTDGADRDLDIQRAPLDSGGLGAAPRPLTDSQIARLSKAEIEERARQLNNPYIPENAPELLRLMRAWDSKQMAMLPVDTNDPLGGLASGATEIFGDVNILGGDAARQHEAHRHHKRHDRVQTFEVQEIVVDPSKGVGPADAIQDAAHRPGGTEGASGGRQSGNELRDEAERLSAPEWQLKEVGVAAVEVGEGILGDVVPAALDAAFQYIDSLASYAGALKEAGESKREGGKLDGMLWGIVAANTLADQRRLGELMTMKADAWHREVLGNVSVRMESSAQRHGATSEGWAVASGHYEGIELVGEQLRAAMLDATRRYRAMARRAKSPTDVEAFRRLVFQTIRNETVRELHAARKRREIRSLPGRRSFSPFASE